MFRFEAIADVRWRMDAQRANGKLVVVV